MTMKQRNLSAPGQPLPRRLATRGLAGLLSLALLAAPLAQAQSPNTRARGEPPVTLNFVNADIEGVTRAMAAILKQQFVVDPRVKGSITLYSEEPLTPREAYLNFLAALRGLGFTVVESGGIYKVVPEADAKLQAGTVSVGDVGRRGDQVITQIFKLNHESANNMVPVLRPLISPNNTINANPGNNSLVITDYADNLQRIAKIIAAMDTPAAGDVEVITLQHAVASDIAAMVQRLTDPGGGGPVVPGLASVGAASILVEPRSNSLLVRAPNPARMAAIRSLVAKLDQPISGNSSLGNIWVVYLKNADAVKLAAVLRAAYTGGGSSTATTSTTSTTPAGNIAQTTQSTQSGPGASAQATAPLSQSASPSTGGFVQADPSTNSLIITAPEPMYRQLRAMIDQLDSRRAQIYIESMIVEVSGDNAA
ncbi:partial Putative secretin GspD, partial [Gammaproteobacteria bacterium]